MEVVFHWMSFSCRNSSQILRFAHSCTSPSRSGSFWLLRLKSVGSMYLLCLGIGGRLLESVVRFPPPVGCSGYRVSSLGSQVCRWQPLSTARLCSLSLYLVRDFLSLGSVTVLRYSAIVYCLFRAKWHETTSFVMHQGPHTGTHTHQHCVLMLMYFEQPLAQ